MIDVLAVAAVGGHRLHLLLSDGTSGIWDGSELVAHSGSLLVPLRSEVYFARAFLDAGAVCWPNGLELSAATLQDQLRNQGTLVPRTQAA